jgi:hypothetical protein
MILSCLPLVVGEYSRRGSEEAFARDQEYLRKTRNVVPKAEREIGKIHGMVWVTVALSLCLKMISNDSLTITKQYIEHNRKII